MLFLAVFCGFLAENQREHIIEHNREKQFIRSLVNDVAADTARLNAILKSRDLRELQLDSLTFLVNNYPVASQTGDVYYYSHTINRYLLYQFTPNDGTMQQLKNAGGLRLIRKRIVADSIIKYDVASRALQRLGEQEMNVTDIYREMAPKMLDANELAKISGPENEPIRLTSNPPLLSSYKEFLNEYNYRLLSVKNVNKGYRRETRKLLKQATTLLVTLKKEYHLD